MADVNCAMCGEPWDCDVNGPYDMELLEKQRFNKGEGCTCCGFGKYCPSCDGSGKEDKGDCCRTCYDRGYVLAWIPKRSTNYGLKADQVYMGYSPNVRKITDEEFEREITLGKRKFPSKIRRFTSADGPVEEWWVTCPDCHGENDGLPCERCDGSGELDTDPERELQAAAMAMEASDEDGLDILERRGLV